MTIQIKFPTIEMMKMSQTVIVTYSKEELFDAREYFVLCRYDENSVLGQLPIEFFAHFVSCTPCDMVLTRMKQKAFSCLVRTMPKAHGGPEYIGITNGTGKDVETDLDLRECLKTTTQFSAVIKRMGGKSCKVLP